MWMYIYIRVSQLDDFRGGSVLYFICWRLLAATHKTLRPCILHLNLKLKFRKRYVHFGYLKYFLQNRK